MNSLALRAVVAELDSHRGRRLERVLGIDPWEIHLRMDRGVTLVLCLHPEHNTLFLTDGGEDPPTGIGFPFARAAGKTLLGTRFAGAFQAGLDRVCALGFDRRDRLGDSLRVHLVAELTGKGGNLVLVDGDDPWTGKILDRLRGDHSRHRVSNLTTGSVYAAPSASKPDITVASADTLALALENTLVEHPGPRALIDAWAGVGPVVAAEVWRRAGAGSVIDAGVLTRTWLALFEETTPARADKNGGPEFRPTLYRRPRGRLEAFCFRPTPTDASPADPTVDQEAPGDAYPTVSSAAAAAHTDFRERFHPQSHSVFHRPVQQAILRARRGLESQNAEQESARSAPQLRRVAEALLTGIQEIPKGAATAEIIDPRDGGKLTVRLNPKLSSHENAELYFKRARKASRTLDKAAGRRCELEERRNALEELARKLEKAGASDPDPAWFEEARRLGVKLPREDVGRILKAPPEDRLPSALRPRRYDLGNGWEALVGKSNRGNEVLTHEIARSHDTWMHADQAAGSHLVLRHHEKGREVPHPVLLAAASIAAFFSKARHASKVPVLVTEKRHVRRPRKAPVGTVTVGRHKSVMVAPVDPDKRKDRT